MPHPIYTVMRFQILIPKATFRYLSQKWSKDVLRTQCQTFDVIRNNVKKVVYGDLSRPQQQRTKWKQNKSSWARYYPTRYQFQKLTPWCNVITWYTLEFALISYSEFSLSLYFFIFNLCISFIDREINKKHTSSRLFNINSSIKQVSIYKLNLYTTVAIRVVVT